MAVPIIGGKATLNYPSSLKQSITDTHIICHSVTSFTDFDKLFMIFCDVSTYRQQDSQNYENLIQFFRSSSSITYFPSKLTNTLNFSPDKMYFHLLECVGVNESKPADAYNGVMVGVPFFQVIKWFF